ncbi:ABC transporter ATP-binding protein [Novosphingobium sp. M1R2S20]|uniref:ABC transporter ATP-binding protein n=1 Tax=Novosphingobium rhizovicinum TaxID=3228928 RepID=A0ABV3REJ9_9SPHN
MVTITIEGLCADLQRRPVLNDISATLAPGKMIGIIGPNGSGKSTLVRAILGLVRARRGSILVDRRDVSLVPPRELARTIAYLPQGQTLHWPLSVERLILLGRLPHLGPLSRVSEEHARASQAAMARADVTHLSGRIVTELSGGERARVMLARALAVGAPAIVADEPLAALDPGHQMDVMELLSREAKAGSLVVVVLHDLTMAARYCDQILLLNEGSLVADGPAPQVLTEQALMQVYGITAAFSDCHGRAAVIPFARMASSARL